MMQTSTDLHHCITNMVGIAQRTPRAAESPRRQRGLLADARRYALISPRCLRGPTQACRQTGTPET